VNGYTVRKIDVDGQATSTLPEPPAFHVEAEHGRLGSSTVRQAGRADDGDAGGGSVEVVGDAASFLRKPTAFWT
jgi:hypothetical protein